MISVVHLGFFLLTRGLDHVKHSSVFRLTLHLAAVAEYLSHDS